MAISSLRVTIFDTECIQFRNFKPNIKIALIMNYTLKFVPHTLLGANSSTQHDFL